MKMVINRCVGVKGMLCNIKHAGWTKLNKKIAFYFWEPLNSHCMVSPSPPWRMVVN